MKSLRELLSSYGGVVREILETCASQHFQGGLKRVRSRLSSHYTRSVVELDQFPPPPRDAMAWPRLARLAEANASPPSQPSHLAFAARRSPRPALPASLPVPFPCFPSLAFHLPFSPPLHPSPSLSLLLPLPSRLSSFPSPSLPPSPLPFSSPPSRSLPSPVSRSRARPSRGTCKAFSRPLQGLLKVPARPSQGHCEAFSRSLQGILKALASFL